MKTLRLYAAAITFSLVGANWLSAQTVLTTLYTFPNNGTSANNPTSALIHAADGNYYGTTYYGGNGAGCTTSGGCGTVFKVTPAGVVTTLYNLCSLARCSDGEFPDTALVQGTDGNLYGTTNLGGASTVCSTGCGSIFKITTTGTLTTLYSFCLQTGCPDGQFPVAALVQGSDGYFYGTTNFGGANNASACFASNVTYVGCGTVFKMTPNGALSTLYSFCSILNGQGLCLDGFYPIAALVQGSDGNFYGTTSQGGANQPATGDGGTVFRIASSGQLTTIYAFCSLSKCMDGSHPSSNLTEVGGGTFYGTTSAGGTATGPSTFPCNTGCGTIFSVTLPGNLSTIYNFCSQKNCADGRNPGAGLVQGRNGNLYGVTPYGGYYDDNYGTIFVATTAGTFHTLHKFCYNGICSDGGTPFAALTEAPDGTFYGTTSGVPTIFHLTGSKVMPASYTFAKRLVGTTSGAKTFTLTNEEGVILTGITASTTGDFSIASTTCTATLAVKASCKINVTFTPTQIGLRQGQLSVSDNANNSPQVSTLTGTGR